MAIKPVLFKGDMVNAILNGEKTQTRRPIKYPEEWDLIGYMHCYGDDHYFYVSHPCGTFHGIMQAPYAEGDILYVRETWREWEDYDAECGCGGDYCTCRTTPKHPACYRADHGKLECEDMKEAGLKWKPSLHMPKKYSRIFLEITGVKSERIDKISEEDAKREGFPSAEDFMKTWNAIYGDDVPFVWIYSFKICNKPEGF